MLRCQSCGMPLDGDNQIFGTNADGSVNSEFCKYCYKDGNFTSDISLNEMVEKCAIQLVKNNNEVTQNQAREMMREILPTLKRWPEDEKITKNTEKDIIELEEKLRKAMLISDIKVLNELISDNLVFMSPNGKIITKQMDLDCHKSGLQKIFALTPSEQTIMINGDNAVVSVKMSIKGTYGNSDASGVYRYLRLWKKFDNKWQIIAGSAIQL